MTLRNHLLVAMIILTSGASGADDTQTTPLSAPAQLLREAQLAFDAKRYPEAARGLQRIVGRHSDSPEVGRAQLLLLECHYLLEDFPRALATIDEILGDKPSAETLSTVVKRKYDIGYAYLNGAPKFFLGIPVSGEGTGVDILQNIADDYPFEPFSDDALFHLAGNYFENGRYEQAEAIYERLTRVYLKSEWVGIAEYQIGETAIRRVKGVEYDFALVDKAEASFKRYLRRYPRGNKKEDALRQLKVIDTLRAEKLFGIAQFYLKEKRLRAARYYLQRIIKDHPDASVEKEAKQLLKTASTADAR